MGREIIFYKEYFIEFYQEQEKKLKDKILQVLILLKQVDRVPEKFLKHLTGTGGLYEIRITYKFSIYRIFCCFDKGKVIVLFNAFQKKTNKTPAQELERGVRLMHEYFANKN